MRPVVLAVAITGSVPRKADNPAVPITVAEQVESTHEAFEAGASLAHIHVRNPNETPSSDPQLFSGVIEGVRRYCPGRVAIVTHGPVGSPGWRDGTRKMRWVTAANSAALFARFKKEKGQKSSSLVSVGVLKSY